ncbi:hypothetical protein ACWF94_34585 [Streptomyces sp. NPDC055078]
MTPLTHSRNGVRRLPGTAWLRCAVAVLLAALLLCLSTADHHRIQQSVPVPVPVPVAAAGAGALAPDALPAPAGTVTAECPPGEVCCAPQAHHAAVLTAQAQHESVLPPEQSAMTAPNTARTAGPPAFGCIAPPDLHVLQVLRT